MQNRSEIYERIFEELVDNDLINLEDYAQEQAKKVVFDILENRLKDYHIIKGELL